MEEIKSETDDLCVGLNNIGISFIEKNESKEASKNDEEDIKKDNSKENTTFNGGICKVLYNKAIENYKKDLSSNPQDVNNLKQLALLYKKIGKFNESAEAIDKLIVLDEENEDYKKSKILIQQIQNEKNDLQAKIKDKDYSQAEILCKKLLEEAPQAYDIQKEYILLLINNYKYHELLLFLLNDVSEENKNIYKDLNYYLALSLYYECKFKEAKALINSLKKNELKDDLNKQCDDILKKIESNESVINKGENLIIENELDRAIQLYDSEIEKKENTKAFNSLLLSKKAFCYYKKEKYDKALEDCNKSININPNNSYSYVIRGMIKTQMSSEDAEEDFEKAKEIDILFSSFAKEFKNDEIYNKSSDISPKGKKKSNKLATLIKEIPYVLKPSGDDIDRNNDCLNQIPKTKLKICQENKTSIEEFENKENKEIINDDEVSLGLKVFKQGVNLKFGQNKNLNYKHEKSAVVAKCILYSIRIKEEKDITFNSKFIEQIKKLTELKCADELNPDKQNADELKAQELEKIVQNTGFYIPLKMNVGGLYTFNTEKMNKNEKKEFLSEVSVDAYLAQYEIEMEAGYKHKKGQEKGTDFLKIERSCTGGEMNENYYDWIKSVKIDNSAFIEYSEFRDIFEFLEENLKKQLEGPINIIRNKYKKRINYMKIIEDLKKNPNVQIFLEDCKDLPEVYSDKIPIKKVYKFSEEKHEYEYKKSYKDIIIGFKINSLKEKNGTPSYHNPLLKKEISIKFEPYFLCDMNYEIKVYLMKYPE